jgi:FlaG/FlaF family flagellin (archaellin)
MKGISPFIAIVLIIAISVAVGGIMSVWMTGFFSTTTETVSEEKTKQIICTDAGISLKDLKYVSGYLNGTVENTGWISLGNISLQISYLNLSREKITLCLINNQAGNCSISNLTLLTREQVRFNVSSGSNYDKIRVTSNCTNAYDEVERSEVS